MARFLSDQWITMLDAAAVATPGIADLVTEAIGDRTFVICQTVTGSSPDPTSYRVTFDGTDGVGVRAGAGPADVTFVQDLETAVGISTGSLSALAALQVGRLSVNGDVDSLHLLQPVLAALDTTWSPLEAAADPTSSNHDTS